MEKVVAAFEARRQFGKILQEVLSRGDRFVVKRHGEEVAAIVPIEVYKEWKGARTAFFDKVKAASLRANLSPEQADPLAEKAVTSVRSQKSN